MKLGLKISTDPTVQYSNPTPTALHISNDKAPLKIAPSEDNNFLARYKYGNRHQNGLKIVHCNKGSSYLVNKKNDIEAVIEKHKPHILGLSEANLFSNQI